MSLTYSIPIADLNDFINGAENKREKFIHTVGHALRDQGFFALTNHSINSTLIDDAYKQSEMLFSLPKKTKLELEISGLKGQRGYTSFGKEHAKDSSAPDLKEFWHVGQEFSNSAFPDAKYPKNIWPKELSSFQPTMLDIYGRLEQSAFAILEACSLYMGKDAGLLRDMANHGNSILRLIHYPPIPEDRNPASVRAGAHEDINLITLLIDATASGLEILDRHGKWIPVITPKGCIIVDSGDMLQNLTNGFFKSTTHRVANPQNNRERRYSIPFFVHARGEVELNPLASCIAATGGVQLYPNITADQFLTQRLQEIGLS